MSHHQMKAYLFRDKDPIIDKVRTCVQDFTGSRKLSRHELRQITEAGGPSVGCMAGWFFDKVKRPQNANVEGALSAMGYERVIRRRGRNSR